MLQLLAVFRRLNHIHSDSLRQHGFPLLLAAAIALAASLGGAWGTALGQTAPQPTATEVPPTATAVPPTATPVPPMATPTPLSTPLTPAVAPATPPPLPRMVVPTLGPLVPITFPSELPAGIPEVTAGGMVGILGDKPGVGILRTTTVNGAHLELRVDTQGPPLAVRYQPLKEPPPELVLPPNTMLMRQFSLDIYEYDQANNTARSRTEQEKEKARPVVLRTQLTWSEWNSLRGDGGVPDPSRAIFARVTDGKTIYLPTSYSPDPPPYGSLTTVFAPKSSFLLMSLSAEQRARVVPADERYFWPTTFRVNRDSFWDYFNKRGGLRTFGYPVSEEFTLLGSPVQFFQRFVLQSMPDGSVARLNLLDEGLMPYTQINFSTFPGVDQEFALAAPPASDPDYAEKSIAFLQANVPDRWEGLPVNFLKTFLSTVRYEDAFPQGDGQPALIPLLNLELWGLPTSKPAFDPNNQRFVYQRFQRGILHYDASTGATQGLLLADYLKSVMTGWRLPEDLEDQAQGSRFYRQYNKYWPAYMARPGELEGTTLLNAFEPHLPQE